MPIKNYVVCVIENDGKILMRKKPEGSPLYTETWYLFGAEFEPKKINLEKFAEDTVKRQLNIEVKAEKTLGTSEETKPDSNGNMVKYQYFNFLCKYVAGEPTKPKDAEKLEWVSIPDLKNYDLVPPSVQLFKQLGYLK